MGTGEEAGLEGGVAALLNGNGALGDDGMDIDQAEGRGGGVLEDSATAMMRAGNDRQGHAQESDARMDASGVEDVGEGGGGDVGEGEGGGAGKGEGKGAVEGEGGDMGEGEVSQGHPGGLSHRGRSGSRDEVSGDETTGGSNTEPRPKPASKPKPGKARGKNPGTGEKLLLKITKKGHRESRDGAKASLSKQFAAEVDAFFVSDAPHASLPPHPSSPGRG